MENEHYDMYAVNELELKWDKLAIPVKKRRNGKVKEVYVEIPDKEKSLELINKFMGAVKETGFNASIVGVRKDMLYGSCEHFLHVRIGSYLYYLGERGVDEIVDLIRKNETITYIQQRASNFGMRKTASHKRMLQGDVMACVDDPDRVVNELSELTDKELTEKYGDRC